MKNVPNYEKLYVESYEKNNQNATLSGRLLQKSHYLLEKSVPEDMIFNSIIEVGSGSGHHYSYVKNNHSNYIMTDSSEEMLTVARKKYASSIQSGKLVIKIQDATQLDFPDESFDRLIATHVLEHIINPVAVLREWNRVVKKGGLISLVLPCDPGLLWRLGRNFGPRRNAVNLGLPYDYVQAADHVNSIFNLVVFIRHHFDNISERWYPARIPFADLNLFYVCHIKK